MILHYVLDKALSRGRQVAKEVETKSGGGGIPANASEFAARPYSGQVRREFLSACHPCHKIWTRSRLPVHGKG